MRPTIDGLTLKARAHKDTFFVDTSAFINLLRYFYPHDIDYFGGWAAMLRYLIQTKVVVISPGILQELAKKKDGVYQCLKLDQMPRLEPPLQRHVEQIAKTARTGAANRILDSVNMGTLKSLTKPELPEFDMDKIRDLLETDLHIDSGDQSLLAAAFDPTHQYTGRRFVVSTEFSLAQQSEKENYSPEYRLITTLNDFTAETPESILAEPDLGQSDVVFKVKIPDAVRDINALSKNMPRVRFMPLRDFARNVADFLPESR